MAIRVRTKPKIEKVHGSAFSSASELLSHAEQHGINSRPLDLTSLCKSLNILISYKPLRDNLSGSLEYLNERWVITVNALHHEGRQRFTIAHELGHYCLHKRSTLDAFDDEIFHRGNGYSLKEFQADSFAGELLMPENDFRHYINDISTNINEIADHFGTSAMAVRKRADILRQGRR